jgi:ectoine hydroxylase-related dioxygenase (phytanoyl-CoA dioxygenase family)
VCRRQPPQSAAAGMAQLLSREQIDAWDRDGFLICRSVLSPQQAEVARQITLVDPTLAAAATGNANYYGSEQHDGAAAAAESGLPPPLKTVLSHAEFSPSDDVCSAWAASARVLRPLEQLFRSPVAHYYSILMRKEPNTGGWLYHQDYGYHYAQFLRPDGYASAMLALAPATKDNGCLRVYRGSHRLGRLEHASVGAQQIADPERVARAAQVLEEVSCELAPGDVLYFHGNTLHASAPNLSETSRWSIVYSYAAADNPVAVRPDPTTALPVGGLEDDAVEVVVEKHALRLREEGLMLPAAAAAAAAAAVAGAKM